jgi:MFS family permease
VLTVIFADKSRASIWILNMFSMLLGVLTAMYWPPLMGWVSRGYEGQGLSHRLGSFNMSWSSGSWISPYIGGLLVGVNSIYPMAAALIAGIGAMAGINLTSNPAKTGVTQAAADPAENVDEQSPNLARFQWMARLALLVSFVAIGLMRSQLGLLFKFELGFSEAKYGLAITTMCFANFVTFWAMGRNHKWHYKVWPFVLSQVFIALSLVMIIEYKSLGIMLAAAGVVGLSEAFIYTSHLFYGVSGGKRRLGLMAVHEFLLSSGIVIGSVVGGYISDGFGRYMPYWFGLWTVAAAIFAQAAIWYAVKPVKAVYANPDSEQK